LDYATEAGRVLEKMMEDSRSEITKLRCVMDALHSKHKEMSAEIGTARDLQVKDQSEINRLAGMYMLRHLIGVGMQIGCLLYLACLLSHGSKKICVGCIFYENISILGIFTILELLFFI